MKPGTTDTGHHRLMPPATTQPITIATMTTDPPDHRLNATTGSTGQVSTVAKAYAAVPTREPAYAYPFLKLKTQSKEAEDQGRALDSAMTPWQPLFNDTHASA